MDDDTRRINRLLSDGKLSGPEHDEILERVFETLAREKRARALRTLRNVSALACAAAAAVMLVVYRPRGPEGEVHLPEEGVFGPRLRVTCSEGDLAACPTTSTLLFTLSGPPTTGVLSAYAEPLEPAGSRVFLFTRQDGAATLAAPPAALASDRAQLRTAALPPGRYRLHAVLANRALDRDELTAVESAKLPGVELRARAHDEIIVTR